MSGHSHWKSVKHQKAAASAKRSKIFSKLSKSISVAAKAGGPNPETNTRLKIAIEEARAFHVPRETIEKAVKRGSGEIIAGTLEEFIVEALGPQGLALIIEGITDNKNRAFGEIKKVLSENNGKLAELGSVRWLFEKRGVISIKIPQGSKENKGSLELEIIEAGAEDIKIKNGFLEVLTLAEDLDAVRKNLEAKGIKTESATLDWIAKEELVIPATARDATEKLFEDLGELDDVQEIYSNAKI